MTNLKRLAISSGLSLAVCGFTWLALKTGPPPAKIPSPKPIAGCNESFAQNAVNRDSEFADNRILPWNKATESDLRLGLKQVSELRAWATGIADDCLRPEYLERIGWQEGILSRALRELTDPELIKQRERERQEQAAIKAHQLQLDKQFRAAREAEWAAEDRAYKQFLKEHPFPKLPQAITKRPPHVGDENHY